LLTPSVAAIWQAVFARRSHLLRCVDGTDYTPFQICTVYR